MRKILGITAFLINILCLAQNQPQLLNGDFENWAPFTPCTGIDSVTNYLTSINIIITNDLKHMQHHIVLHQLQHIRLQINNMAITH